jgi:hypothetical protein
LFVRATLPTEAGAFRGAGFFFLTRYHLSAIIEL